METFEEELDSIQQICNSQRFNQNIEKIRTIFCGKPLILYGAGILGCSVARVLAYYHIEMSCFCDKSKRGIQKDSGLPIISPRQMIKEYPNANIIICSVNYKDEIIRDLISLGIHAEKIYLRDELCLHEMTYENFLPHIEGYKQTYNLLEDDKSKQILLERFRCYLLSEPITSSKLEDQYFDSEIIALTSREIIVDGGMYTGDTAQAFFRVSNNQYAHYYGFEPDGKNFYTAKENLCGQPDVTLVQKGLWKQ